MANTIIVAPEDDETRISEVKDIHHITLPGNQRFKPSDFATRVIRGVWTSGQKAGRNAPNVQAQVNLIRRRIKEFDKMLTRTRISKN